jgi:N-acetylneuraminic acid mutarotase
MKKTSLIFHRLMIICCSVAIAGTFLVILLTSLSNTAAASGERFSETYAINNTTSERWKILADMNKNRGDPGVVAYNNKIYVMGGYFPSFFGYNQTQEVYDPQTNSWQFLANLLLGRSDMMVANVGDRIYAIGGWNVSLGGAISNTEQYDTMTDSWITRTSMITAVSGAGVVVPTSTIYIIGGVGRLSVQGAVQKYDPISNTWSLGTPLSVPRSELGAALLNGKIYAIGGVTTGGITTNTVEIYYPITDTWKMGPPLPESRASMAVGVRQGKIYVVGGTDNWTVRNPVNTTFVFDPFTNVWSTENPMPTSRRACRAATVNDILYVIGGEGSPGAGSANEGFGFPPVTSTITISSDDPDPSQITQPFTVTYAVTASGEIPTGVVTVTVENNLETCNGLLTNGSGSCQLALPTLGAYTLTATYGGNYILLGSSVTDTHNVIKANTTTSITADDPDPSVIGQPITVTYAVTSPFGLPTGSVMVTASNSPASCSGILTNAIGTCSLTLNAAGSYTLTATYSGDANFSPSSSTQAHSVSKMDSTTTILTDNPDPSFVNQPISITYTVTSPFGIPTGPVTVTVSNSNIACSNVLTNGNGNCSIILPTAGTFTLNAEYNGTATFNPSNDSEMHSVVPHKIYLPLTTR